MCKNVNVKGDTTNIARKCAHELIRQHNYKSSLYFITRTSSDVKGRCVVVRASSARPPKLFLAQKLQERSLLQ